MLIIYWVKNCSWNLFYLTFLDASCIAHFWNCILQNETKKIFVQFKLLCNLGCGYCEGFSWVVCSCMVIFGNKSCNFLDIGKHREIFLKDYYLKTWQGVMLKETNWIHCEDYICCTVVLQRWAVRTWKKVLTDCHCLA